MNPDLFSIYNLNPSLMEPVIKILSTPHYVSPWYYDLLEIWRFTKERNLLRVESYQNNAKITELSQYNCQDNQNDKIHQLESYWMWDQLNLSDTLDKRTSKYEKIENNQKLNDENIFKSVNFQNYKELRRIVRKTYPWITKEALYENLLLPFKHDKMREWNKRHTKIITIYIWKYDNCNKEFDKIWNILDHMRMHEGIKPFTCKICGISFTQK